MFVDNTSELTTIFDYDGPKHRQERVDYAMSKIPRILEKNYPMRRVIPLIHRLAVVNDEGFADDMALRGYGKGRLIEPEMYMIVIGGSPAVHCDEKLMIDYCDTIDMALNQAVDPYNLAAWAFLQLGELKPFPEGTGRTQRVFTNYILANKAHTQVDWRPFTKNGHLDIDSAVGQIMAEYNKKLYYAAVSRGVNDPTKSTMEHLYDIAQESNNQARK